MTEFKNGDRIVAVRDTMSDYGKRLPKGATGTVVESQYASLAFRPDDGTLGTRRHIRPEDFAHAEPETHAAPDPKAVKAGDTVTADIAQDGPRLAYTVAGEVYDGPTRELYVGGWPLTHSLVTLTAHTPAPEPEPEWEPGTTGTATLNNLVSGNGAFDMRVMRVEWDGLHGFATQTGRVVEDGSTTWSISDFVPDESRPLPTRDEVAAALQGVPNVTTWDRSVGSGSLTTRSAGVLADAVVALLLRGEAR